MSIKRFESVLLGLLGGNSGGLENQGDEGGRTRIPDPSDQINPGDGNKADTARALNAAFLITLAGPGHRLFWEADVLFEKIIRTEEGSRLGRYYQRGRSAIWREIEPLDLTEPQLEEILTALAVALKGPAATRPDLEALFSDQESSTSKIPVTVAYLRCALDAATLFAGGKEEEATKMLRRAALEG